MDYEAIRKNMDRKALQSIRALCELAARNEGKPNILLVVYGTEATGTIKVPYGVLQRLLKPETEIDN